MDAQCRRQLGHRGSSFKSSYCYFDDENWSSDFSLRFSLYLFVCLIVFQTYSIIRYILFSLHFAQPRLGNYTYRLFCTILWLILSYTINEAMLVKAIFNSAWNHGVHSENHALCQVTGIISYTLHSFNYLPNL